MCVTFSRLRTLSTAEQFCCTKSIVPLSLSSHKKETYKIYCINSVLTCRNVPGEVEEIFGTRDGDHLSNISTGPAGDLVPHPTASWANRSSRDKRQREAKEGLFVIGKHGKHPTQDNNTGQQFETKTVFRWFHSSDKQATCFRCRLSPGGCHGSQKVAKSQLLLQPWVHNSGWPELTHRHHD